MLRGCKLLVHKELLPTTVERALSLKFASSLILSCVPSPKMPCVHLSFCLIFAISTPAFLCAHTSSMSRLSFEPIFVQDEIGIWDAYTPRYGHCDANHKESSYRRWLIGKAFFPIVASSKHVASMRRSPWVIDYFLNFVRYKEPWCSFVWNTFPCLDEVFGAILASRLWPGNDNSCRALANPRLVKGESVCDW